MTFEVSLRLVAAPYEVVTNRSPSTNGRVLGRLLFSLQIFPPEGTAFAYVSFAYDAAADLVAAPADALVARFP